MIFLRQFTLLLVLVPFVFNGASIAVMVIEKITLNVSEDLEEESENQELDSENEVKEFIQNTPFQLVSFKGFCYLPTSFLFSEKLLCDVQFDLVSPPPDSQIIFG